jgi:hypothetical protein
MSTGTPICYGPQRDDEASSGVAFALAPSPDYRCDLPPGVEICSCDEALALRVELGKAHARLATRDRRAAVIGAEVPLDYRAFCPLCGVGAGFDDEGCCTTCGATVCSMQHLVGHLAAARLRVVEAEAPPEPEEATE